ncbi:MAG: AraC family transcriptional regulator [Bacteroidota bacterium]
MSKTYFCRWFKKMTGHTFTAYRDKVLIERFCQELISSDKNISNLAFNMGFESIFHFNRTFKKWLYMI